MKLVFDSKALSDIEAMVVPRLPYIIVYEVDASADRLIIIAVFHGAQDREPRAD